MLPQGIAFSEEEKLAVLAEARKEKVEEFRERFANPYVAAERGYIDAVIRPSETRRRLNTRWICSRQSARKILPRNMGIFRCSSRGSDVVG